MKVVLRKMELIPPPIKGNDLRFAIATQPRVESFWRSLVVVFSRQERFTPHRPVYMFRGLNNRWFQTPAQSLAGSSAINIIFVFALLWFVKPSAIATNNLYAVNSEPQWIYYNVPIPTPNRARLKIAPAGPGGVPGQGQLKDKLTALGSTAFHPTLSVISQPLHPDNTHQTILQPDAPPNSLLNKDFDLPNILPTSANLPSRPQKQLTWTAPKASPRTGQPTAESTFPIDSNPNSNSTITIQGATTPDPALLVPPQPSQTQVNSELDSKMGTVGTLQQSNVASGDGSGIVVLSTDPNGVAGRIGLPLGNRMGAFSISPYGTSTGSPGGAKGASQSGGGGAGGAVGTGGDGSVGVGSGNSGGGQGGPTKDSGIFSMSGTDGGKGGGYNLPSTPVISEMVIPIASKLQLRKNALTISTGPMGGGGLPVYQALPCMKIYTIFLPMPGTNWTLQYCARDDSGTKQSTLNGNNTVRLAEGLVPPQPQTEFDFQRLPVSAEKTGKMIVLKGEIRDDGTVSDVQIYAGVMPTMDEAARLAFSQWKFIPAMRSGKPVGVMVLVGIAANPQSHQ
jgi:hypothetical protein